MKKIYNPNKLFINKKNILKNISLIENYIGPNYKLMPIIKANAYGIGTGNILPIVNETDINIIGVANIQEAIEVRKNFKKDILILLQPMKEQIPFILKNDISTNVSDLDFCIQLNKYAEDLKTKAKIHIEIDTGMSRTGTKAEKIIEFINKISTLSNIQIDGISTHLSSSGKDKNFTNIQIEKFRNVLKIIKEKNNIDFKYIHVYASGGLIGYPLYNEFNTVRCGIMLYGYYPNKLRNILLFPSLSLYSKVSYIQSINKNDSVGYNRTFIAKNNTKLAIIPIGFADGFMGLESNIAHVYINKKPANLVAICMDTMIVDITNINNVKIGDDVILWDNENITLDEWGEWTKSSSYEVLSILSERINKVVI